MKKNYEIKIKLDSASHVKTIRKSLSKFTRSSEKQTDIYYKVSNGRLKLRIINDRDGNLIFYKRPDTKGKRISKYIISRTKDFKDLDAILSGQFPILVKVSKIREVYILKNIRVHLDKVKKLGNFLEIEIIYKDFSGAKKQMEYLIETLDLDEKKFIKNSYSDLLLKK